MKRRRKPLEDDIHHAVMAHIRMRGVRGLFVWHTPNGGFRNAREAKNLQRKGTRPGMPDLMACLDGDNFALELKREGGRTTEQQYDCLATLRMNGWHTAIEEGMEAALRRIHTWGWVR